MAQNLTSERATSSVIAPDMEVAKEFPHSLFVLYAQVPCVDQLVWFQKLIPLRHFSHCLFEQKN